MAYYSRRNDFQLNRLPSGLFFRVDEAEQLMQPPLHRSNSFEDYYNPFTHPQVNNFATPTIPHQTTIKGAEESYLPLLQVSVEVQVVGAVSWTKLTQTFTNRAAQPIKESTYCFPLYDGSAVTAFTCTIGVNKVLKGVVKPKEQAKAEFKEAVARRKVAALLEEHTPEVFETSIGNIPSQTTVKVEISYITELKGDINGEGLLVTIPTSVAPRYGTPPHPAAGSSSSIAVPPENGLQIQIQVLSPVAISKIESKTHPVSVEMGAHSYTTTRNIRDLSSKQETSGFDPKKAKATLADRSACLGKDFVLLIQAREGQLLASRAIIEPHPMTPNRSALMVSINLRDMYTPNVVSPKESREIVFLADRSGSMNDKMEALKTAIRFFLKSLPNNCIFNICSFGTNYQLLWPESRSFGDENIQIASDYVTTRFAADMGGTEILSGLQQVVKTSNPHISTEIIILTDGEVWNSDTIFDFIRETRSSGPKMKTRFFCLGIGEAVSHQLVTGIGRLGGGLAEAVPADSSGDWMRKVIGMLGAALTPSSWKVEVSLDNLPKRDKEDEDRGFVQAPHHTPQFHAFSRSSVYFVLNQEISAKVVKVKATAIDTEEVITTEIPIEKLDTRRPFVHQLASKAILNDFESGQSKLHEQGASRTDTQALSRLDDLIRTEAEKIGTEWSLTSKWTSFIVVDDTSSTVKACLLYKAEKSDLADLTRSRYDAVYGHQIERDRGPGSHDELTRYTMSQAPRSLCSASYSAAYYPPVVNVQGEKRRDTRSEIIFASRLARSQQQTTGSTSPPQPRFSVPPPPQAQAQAQAPFNREHYQQADYSGSSRVSRVVFSAHRTLPPLNPAREVRESALTLRGEECIHGEGFGVNTGNAPPNTQSNSAAPETANSPTSQVDPLEMGLATFSDPTPILFTSHKSPTYSIGAIQQTEEYNDLHCTNDLYARLSNGSYNLTLSDDFETLERAVTPPMESYPKAQAQPSQSQAQKPILESLLTTQLTTGSFALTASLRSALISTFPRSTRTAMHKHTSSQLKKNPTLHFQDFYKMWDTVMVVVYIEREFKGDRMLWGLVLQKARAWVEGFLKSGEGRDEGEKEVDVFALVEDERRVAG